MYSLIDSSEKIIKYLNIIHKNYRRKVTAEIGCGEFKDFTVQQISVMMEVGIEPGITLNELSKKVKLANSTVSGIVDRLEKKNAIVKIRPENNKRVLSITLSEEMEKKMKEVKEIKNRYTVQILSRFEEKEIEEILNSLEKLAIEIEKD